MRPLQTPAFAGARILAVSGLSSLRALGRYLYLRQREVLKIQVSIRP